MITFGHYNLIPYLKEDTIIFNFSSFKEGYPVLSNMNSYYKYYPYIPNNDYNDMSFINYIVIHNIEAYREFIDIMKLLYNGKDVYIMIDTTMESSNDLIDQLISYIYNTFGYVSNKAQTTDDLLYLREGSFTTEGIVKMDTLIDYYVRTFGYRKEESYE